MRDPASIDVPAAPDPLHELDQEVPSDQQKKCHLIPQAECDAHPSCDGCRGYTPPARGVRA